MNVREKIARRAALELSDGEVVNLGFGIPIEVPNYLKEGIFVSLEAENGCLMSGPTPYYGGADSDNGNAGGNLAPGMGGAMDLVTGARKIVVTMQHTDKKGNSKILKRCHLALTGIGVVNVIITERAVFKVQDGPLLLIEKDPEYTVEDIIACTEADIEVSPDLVDYRMSGINA